MKELNVSRLGFILMLIGIAFLFDFLYVMNYSFFFPYQDIAIMLKLLFFLVGLAFLIISQYLLGITKKKEENPEILYDLIKLYAPKIILFQTLLNGIPLVIGIIIYAALFQIYLIYMVIFYSVITFQIIISAWNILNFLKKTREDGK